MTWLNKRLFRLFEANRPYSALIFLRFGFFTLLAYDLWTISLGHAPRYGVADFNTAHFSWLDSLAPTPNVTSISIVYLVTGTLALWTAVGILGQAGVIACAGMYSFCYFWSQADSYQHHYLLCLILFVFIGMPWRASKRASSTAEPKTAQSSLNALMFQMAVIYGFTALAKCDGAWLSGETLKQTIGRPEIREIVEATGSSFGLAPEEMYRISAWGIMLGEWFAALAFLLAPLRSFAFFVVPWFHIGVEWVGFDIELFSYYMLLLNLTLLSPSRFWTGLDKLSERVWPLREPHRSPEAHFSAQTLVQYSFPPIITAFALSSLLIEETHPSWIYGAVFVSLILGIKRVHRQPITSSLWVISVLFVSISLTAGVKHLNDGGFRFDYYRMWGGDLQRRGELKKAYEIYRKANQAQDPELPARLIPEGEIAIKLGFIEEGLAAMREACRRRDLNLERQAARVTLHSPPTPEALNEFEEAVQRSVQAHRALIKSLSRLKDPSVLEEREVFMGINQLIFQTRQMTK